MLPLFIPKTFRSRPLNSCEVDGGDGIDDATVLAVHGASIVDEGEGGCGVDVPAVLQWKIDGGGARFFEKRERDKDE